MIIFDKAAWHIDAGMNESDVVKKFKSVFDWLDRHTLLSEEGLEILDFGIDSSISLNEKMVTKKGFRFLDEYYDQVIDFDYREISNQLDDRYRLFLSKRGK
ncbi:MAG: hypothetical protein IIT39_12265 [Clostridia bacterium]|nr:hypothetical protein [Clostridia bacterium]